MVVVLASQINRGSLTISTKQSLALELAGKTTQS